VRTNRRPRPWVGIAGLTAIWTLLWGQLSPGNIVGGLVVALVLVASFPLPPVELTARLHPLAALRFVGYFLARVVVASVGVAALALRPRLRLRNAEVVVVLRVRTQLHLALLGLAVSLIPGSIVLDARLSPPRLRLHVLNAPDDASVEDARARVAALEERLLRAIGSAEDLFALDQPRPAPHPGGDQ
jgi:multicomponent Na+:H+ antiporter subunit E